MDTPTTSPEEAPLFDHVDRLMAALDAKAALTQSMIDATPPTTNCPKCQGDAFLDQTSVYVDDITGKPTVPVYICPACTRAKQAQHQRDQLAKIGIPADVFNASLANFRTDRPDVKTGSGFSTPADFLESACRLESGVIRNLILAGTCGIGKTHLAAAIARKEFRPGRRIVWTTCAKLFAAYHAAYKDNSTEKVIEPLIDAGLLVLDEICLRRLPDDGEEILYNIIEPRSKTAGRTILLGNKPAGETREWLGERIRDRLKSGGLDFRYGQWESMRGTDNDGANEF
jgi:DNA replication protein DnaC